MKTKTKTAKTRRAAAKDAPQMAALARAGAPGGGWGTRAIADYMKCNPGTVLVRAEGPTVVGFVMYCGLAIELLVVDAQRQRQGHGAALLDAALAGIAKIGWDIAELNVRAGNKTARAFYRAHGFKRARSAGTYGDGELRVVLRRKL